MNQDLVVPVRQQVEPFVETICTKDTSVSYSFTEGNVKSNPRDVYL